MNIYTVVSFWVFMSSLIIFVFNFPLSIALFTVSIISFIIGRFFQNKAEEKPTNSSFFGIKVFGWTEIIIGALGGVIFTIAILTLLATLIGVRDGQPGDFGLLPITFFTIPFVLVLWGGIGVVRRRVWARKIHLIVIPALIGLLASVLLMFHFINLFYYMFNEPQSDWVKACIFFIFLDVVFGMSIILFVIHLFKNLSAINYFCQDNK
jgi:hypothetical protein